MLSMLLSEFGGYLIAALVAVIGVLGVYFKGRSAGKADAIVERQVVIQKQAEAAKQEVHDVETKIESAPDAAVLDIARSKWVRK